MNKNPALSRWSRPNGYRDVLAIGLPLVVTMGTTTLMQFTDRVFLGNYSLESISAALPAGIASFLFLCFFMGVSGYVNVFVAQYVGAGQPERVGAALWQGIWFSLLAGVILAALYFPAPFLFQLGGHDPEVQRLETLYFRILSLGSWCMLMTASLGCFYTGRGITRPVMFAHLLAALVNIPLDYALINGWGPFPEMGIAGAAWATVIAWFLDMAFLAAIIFTRANDIRFGVRSHIRFDRKLFGRLMRFGLPGGMEFFLDIFAITFFVFMVGRIGEVELAASNMALSLDSLVFMPIIGLHIAASTIVGQAIGKGAPHEGETGAMSAFHLAMVWMWALAILFVVFPEPLLTLFKPRDIPMEAFGPILETGTVLLRFVALYSMFDGVALIFFGAIKGAGDTVYVMKVMGSMSLFVMVIPVYLLVEVFDAGIVAVWLCITAYIACLAAAAWFRYRQGKWKAMRVIESPALPEPAPPIP